ncbi:hypothetical protein C8Q80DRAFT_442723 [Daedaleopsis nitida]|nr:hypothetical protein C8Q80DRAFT_442723 [Daedaleopsis nitida]
MLDPLIVTDTAVQVPAAVNSVSTFTTLLPSSDAPNPLPSSITRPDTSIRILSTPVIPVISPSPLTGTPTPVSHSVISSQLATSFAATSSYGTVSAGSPSLTSMSSQGTRRNSSGTIVAALLGSCALCIVLVIMTLCYCRRRTDRAASMRRITPAAYTERVNTEPIYRPLVIPTSRELGRTQNSSARHLKSVAQSRHCPRTDISPANHRSPSVVM